MPDLRQSDWERVDILDLNPGPIWSDSIQTTTYNVIIGQTFELNLTPLITNDAGVITFSIGQGSEAGTIVVRGNDTYLQWVTVGNDQMGNPIQAGLLYRIGVVATDSEGSNTASFSIMVHPAPPDWSAIPEQIGFQGQPFEFDLKPFLSGTQPITITAMPLPAGLSISNGVISGDPTALGAVTVIAGATNVAGTDSITFMLTVNVPFIVRTESLPTASNANLGSLYLEIDTNSIIQRATLRDLDDSNQDVFSDLELVKVGIGT